MTKIKSDFIQKYIDELKFNISDYSNMDDSGKFETISKVLGVFCQDYPFLEKALSFNSNSVNVDTEILIGLLEKELIDNTENDDSLENCDVKNNKKSPLIFLSHCSKNKKFGDALEFFISSLGVKKEQLIYTSHPLHKIPLDKDIFNYLRENINRNIFVIILWSNEYLNSPACLSEMGATWIIRSNYTNIFVPDFNFGDVKFHECAIDTRKMGAVLKNDDNCRIGMLELKNKIQEMFSLENDEIKVDYYLNEFMKRISE